jgi:N-sulfoglucosamine sulfohydrolase
MNKRKINIVLMVSDDHGREALGCYGNPVIDTSNLDALAADGIRFDHAFCTAASCSASRSAILTGLHNHTNGTYGLTHARHHFACFDSVKTLPARIKEAGYRTGRAGKKHYAPDSIFPFDFNPSERHLDRDDLALAEECRSFIAGDEPFFLYWCSFNPHRGPNNDEPHPCRPNRFGNPEESFPGDKERLYSDDEVIVPPFLSDIPEVRAELAEYYQSISRLDRGVGRLIKILKETGKYDNTLIIYISDNGAAFPASKTTLYDPGMRLPCIIKEPFPEKKCAACDALISWLDIVPTILDYAGIEPDDSLSGRSFRPAADGREVLREEIYASHTFHEITNYYPMRVIRSKKYKFIWNIAHPLTYPFSDDLWRSASWKAVVRDHLPKFGARDVEAYLHRPRFELYDLENDPDELNNLADSPEYAEQVAQHCEKLKQFQKETNDPWLHKWEYE